MEELDDLKLPAAANVEHISMPVDAVMIRTNARIALAGVMRPGIDVDSAVDYLLTRMPPIAAKAMLAEEARHVKSPKGALAKAKQKVDDRSHAA